MKEPVSGEMPMSGIKWYLHNSEVVFASENNYQ